MDVKIYSILFDPKNTGQNYTGKNREKNEFPILSDVILFNGKFSLVEMIYRRVVRNA